MFYIFLYKFFLLTALFSQNQSSHLWSELICVEYWIWMGLILCNYFYYKRSEAWWFWCAQAELIEDLVQNSRFIPLFLSCSALPLLSTFLSQTCSHARRADWQVKADDQTCSLPSWWHVVWERVMSNMSDWGKGQYCLILIGVGEKEKVIVVPFVLSHCLAGKPLKNSSSNPQCLDFPAWQNGRSWWWKMERHPLTHSTLRPLLVFHSNVSKIIVFCGYFF